MENEEIQRHQRVLDIVSKQTKLVGETTDLNLKIALLRGALNMMDSKVATCVTVDTTEHLINWNKTPEGESISGVDQFGNTWKGTPILQEEKVIDVIEYSMSNKKTDEESV